MTKSKAKYVDGYVVVVSKKNVAAYREMAKWGAKVWMKCGALDYKECMGEDLSPSMGPVKLVTFPKMAKITKNETVWFSYITYKSRAHRDAVNKKVHAEMEKQGEKYKDVPMPFDVKRMAYGGFTVEVSG